MNYRHLYHAGNFADVVKHVCLLQLLARLKGKPQPFCYLDTHAGIGRYRLSSAEAQKTGEYRDGVGRLLGEQALPPVLATYLERVLESDADNSAAELHTYPGSPLLARAELRPQDRAVLAELHPEDAASLKQLFKGDPQVAVHHMNGYHALKAFLPPRERRGLVLIDPPFEAEDEFARIVAGIGEAYRRWASGIYAIWYPIKDRREVSRFYSDLERSGIRKILAAEFCRFPEDLPQRFNGCGMLLINPPWKLDEQLREAFSVLARLLAAPGLARHNVAWLVEE